MMNHKKTYTLVLVFFLLTLNVFISKAQHHSFHFTVQGLSNQPVFLKEFHGHDQMIVDSTLSDNRGNISFSIDTMAHSGMYRLEINNTTGLDFIYNNEDVTIITGKDLRLDSLIVENSLENEIFFDYLVRKISYGRRLELLGPLLMYYPQKDTFYYDLESHYFKLELEYNDYLNDIYQDHYDRFVMNIIHWDQLPEIDPSGLTQTRKNHLRAHYFDDVDMSDTLIVYTPLPPAKLIDYLSLYVTPGVRMDKQEDDFITGIDSLMKFTGDNKKLQEVFINYMIDGFQHFGFEKVLTHLVENFVLDNSCISDQEQDKLRERIEGFKKMSVGKKAPDFEIHDVNGSLVRLSAIDKPYVLLVFWASWCPHCSDAITELEEIYRKFKNSIEIIGISVDADRAAWRQALDEKQMGWINVAELQGWDGKTVGDYYIYATPSLLLLDSNRIILSKPANVMEMEMELNKF